MTPAGVLALKVSAIMIAVPAKTATKMAAQLSAPASANRDAKAALSA